MSVFFSLFFFELSGVHRDLHVLTHSFPTRRSSDLSGSRLRQVDGALFSRVDPAPVTAPRVLAHSAEMAAALGFSEADVITPEFAQVLDRKSTRLNSSH